MDYFKLTRAFWDFAFENPEKIKPNHCAMYLFIVEHCNRLGWKEKFGLPTTMVKGFVAPFFGLLISDCAFNKAVAICFIRRYLKRLILK